MEKQKTILIVDDDKFLRSLYQAKFAKEGFVVEVAQSASEALQKIRDGLIPSVIIFDIIMPGIDGVAFVETLKREKLAPRAALVALTNQGQADGNIEKVKSLGVDGYIVKASMIPSEVVAEVHKVLALRGA